MQSPNAQIILVFRLTHKETVSPREDNSYLPADTTSPTQHRPRNCHHKNGKYGTITGSI